MHLFLRFFLVLFSIQITAVSIDVVIPCVEKDLPTLELCIKQIKACGRDIRRVIVVSDKKLTDAAEWCDERIYPMSKEDIAELVYGKRDGNLPRVGWLYQQFLKLYAPFVIPDISENILVLDADTVFLKPVSFFDPDGTALYNVGTEYVPSYFIFLESFFPGFRKVYPAFSGICHHMLLQKEVLTELFSEIESIYNVPFWHAVAERVDKENLYFSEYELYFNYIFAREKKVRIRPLLWTNISRIHKIEKYRRHNFDYVSVHAWMRELR